MDMTGVLGIHILFLQPTINHDSPFMYSGHYITSINCYRNFVLQRRQNYGVWNELFQNSSSGYVVVYKLITGFGLEH